MKPYFRDLDIQCWKHTALRLGTQGPFVCVYQSESSICEPLLTAINELEAAGPPSQRKLTLKPCGRARSRSVIRLALSHESETLRQMCISVDDEAVTIEITHAGLEKLHNAVTAWHAGGEDFGVSPARDGGSDLAAKDLTSGELWFWGPGYYEP